MYMLDTDICIYIIKRKPRSVLKRLESLQPGQLAMSAITFAELMNGAKKSKQVEANVAKLNELAELIEIRPFDQKAAIFYGDVRSTLEKKGNIIGSNDLLIAAHALSLDWILVSNNEKEFRRVDGLRIENWIMKLEVHWGQFFIIDNSGYFLRVRSWFDLTRLQIGVLKNKELTPILLISNGEKAWWYIPGEKTVQVFQVQEYGQTVEPITEFFSGLGGLEKHFTIRLDKTIPEEAPYYALVLQPKNPQPDLNQIHLRILKATLLPLEFTFYNILGDGTRFRLSQVQTAVKVSETAFQFTPPKGVQVITPSVVVPKNSK